MRYCGELLLADIRRFDHELTEWLRRNYQSRGKRRAGESLANGVALGTATGESSNDSAHAFESAAAG